MKIVINDCYGGFGLSYEAMALYLATKFKQAYFYVDLMTQHLPEYKNKRTYKRVELKNIPSISQSAYYIYCTTEDQGKELDHFPTNIFHDREVERTDPDLISVVEFLGSKAASGRYAKLKIEEIPDGTMYRVDTYDGCEEIQIRDNLGWEIADSHNQSTPVNPKLLETVYNNIAKGELS
jgi:hypothetical protein